MSAFSAETATDSFSDAASNLSSTLGLAKDSFENTMRSSYELRVEYGLLADAARNASQQQLIAAEMKLADDMAEMRRQTNGAVGEMREFANIYNHALQTSQDTTASFMDQQNALRLLETSARVATDEFGLSADRVAEIVDAVDDLNGATGLQATQAASSRLVDLLQAASLESDRIPKAIREISIELAPVNSQMIDLLNVASKVGTVLQGIFANAGPGMDFGSTSWYWGESVGNIMPPTPGLAPEEPNGRRGSRARGGGGGGRGRSEADRIREEMEDRVKALQESWLTESQIVSQQYATDQETLQWALDNRLLAEEEYNQRRLEMQRRYDVEMQGLRLAEYANAATSMGDVFGQLAAIQGTNNEKLLRGQRTFAAASSLISAYQGAAAALADPNISWIGRIAAYTSVLAAGLGAVSAIKGGGSGGSSSASRAAATAPAQQKAEPVKNVLVKLEGDAMFMDMAENIMQQIYRQSENGRVIIARG